MTNQSRIFSRPYRALTIGIILSVTVVAFEGLAVTTVAPVLAKDLHGIDLFGWVFSAYLLAQLTGTVITGQQIDQRGPALPFIAALLLFGLGLIIAAIAPTMPILIIGRTLQGFGAGALSNCIYSSIYLQYEDALRTQILAVCSSAYVVPALIGPYVAGIITERASWRYVFWGILPFLFLAGVFALPTFFRLAAKVSYNGQRNLSNHSRIFPAIQLAIGTGLLLTGLGQFAPRGWSMVCTGWAVARGATAPPTLAHWYAVGSFWFACDCSFTGSFCCQLFWYGDVYCPDPQNVEGLYRRHSRSSCCLCCAQLVSSCCIAGKS